MIPLIARLVWLLIESPFAEDLCRRPLKLLLSRIGDIDNALIVDRQSRVEQEISPGSQQRVLSRFVSLTIIPL